MRAQTTFVSVPRQIARAGRTSAILRRLRRLQSWFDTRAMTASVLLCSAMANYGILKATRKISRWVVQTQSRKALDDHVMSSCTARWKDTADGISNG